MIADVAPILALSLLSFTVPGDAICWENLHLKYGLINGFYKVPFTVKEIQKENYVKMAHDSDLNVDLYAYPGDPRVSIMFDSHGNIAGVRTAFIKSEVALKAKSNGKTFKYSYDDKPIFTSGNYFGMDLWYTSVLFIDPEKLKSGGREDTEGQLAENMFMKLDGKWTKIPKDECQAESIGFTKQSCFIGMGMHYFYKVTPDMDCKDFQGAFLLYESGKLIGLGFNPFGSYKPGKDREWFEDVPVSVVKRIVTNGPKCMSDYVSNYGANALHMFFKKYPRLTFCTWPWQKSDQCPK